MTNVLMVSRALIPSVRLCGYEQFRKMERDGKVRFRFCPCPDLTPEIADWGDVILLVRSDSEAELFCAGQWRKAGKYLIYVMDDDLPDIPEGLGSSAFYRRPSTQKNIRSIMRECQGFLSPSAHLREKYGAGFEDVYRVEEPSLTGTDFPASKNDGVIRIGFAGSCDREKDLNDLLSGTAAKLTETFGDRITLEFFGAYPEFARAAGYRHIPYSDSYEAYQATMRTLGWDIGLAPMPDTEFHRGKHYNKMIEYAACGIVGVYSDLLPYRGAVRDGETGLLCPNDPDAFFAALSRLIDDPVLLNGMKQNVRRLAEEDFSLDTVTENLAAELDGVLSWESPHAPAQWAKKLRRLDRRERLSASLRERGLIRTILHVTKKILKKAIGKHDDTEKKGENGTR